MNYALSDYGLGSRPDLKHVCGHYELRADGNLLTWDLFVTASEPAQLKNEVEEEMKLGRSRQNPHAKGIPRTDISLVVESSNHFEWPRGCPKTLVADAHSVLVATRVL
jgi:hypothetical protein